MKSMYCVALFSLLLLVLGCSGKSEQQQAADDSLNIMTEMTQVLAGITDEASAKAASPELEKLAKEMQGFITRMQSFDKDEEVDPEVAAEYQQKSLEISQAFGKEMMRVMQIEGAYQHVAPHLTSMAPPNQGK